MFPPPQHHNILTLSDDENAFIGLKSKIVRIELSEHDKPVVTKRGDLTECYILLLNHLIDNEYGIYGYGFHSNPYKFPTSKQDSLKQLNNGIFVDISLDDIEKIKLLKKIFSSHGFQLNCIKFFIDDSQNFNNKMHSDIEENHITEGIYRHNLSGTTQNYRHIQIEVPTHFSPNTQDEAFHRNNDYYKYPINTSHLIQNNLKDTSYTLKLTDNSLLFMGEKNNNLRFDRLTIRLIGHDTIEKSFYNRQFTPYYIYLFEYLFDIGYDLSSQRFINSIGDNYFNTDISNFSQAQQKYAKKMKNGIWCNTNISNEIKANVLKSVFSYHDIPLSCVEFTVMKYHTHKKSC